MTEELHECEVPELEAYEDYNLYIAMRVPYPDGSGKAAVLGVYTQERYAKARCYTELIWNSVPKECVGVVTRPLNADKDDGYDDEDDSYREEAFRSLEEMEGP